MHYRRSCGRHHAPSQVEIEGAIKDAAEKLNFKPELKRVFTEFPIIKPGDPTCLAATWLPVKLQEGCCSVTLGR
jgi:hypothetical protein